MTAGKGVMPYHMQQAQDAMDQANRIENHDGSKVEEVSTVLAFAQVQATLAVADAIERQTKALIQQTTTLTAAMGHLR